MYALTRIASVKHRNKQAAATAPLLPALLPQRSLCPLVGLDHILQTVGFRVVAALERLANAYHA
jgi:hypothetical protein